MVKLGTKAWRAVAIRLLGVSVTSIRNLLLIAGAVSALSTAAHAVTINFDDLGTGEAPVPNGYNGLDWSNIWSITPSVNSPNSGYMNGIVSPLNDTFNSFAAPGAISVTSGTFTF